MLVAVLGVLAVAAVASGGIWLAVRDGGGSSRPTAVDRTPGATGGAGTEAAPTTTTLESEPAPTTPGTGGGAETGATSSWVELLQRVPDLPENRNAPIEILDYARMRAQLGVALPPADADGAELGAYVASTLPGPFATGDPAAVRDELGFDVADFDQVVSLGPKPGDLVVLRGRFDAAGIAEAVRADPVWQPLLEELQHRQIPVYSWGEDNATLDRASQARPAAESRRLALRDGTVVWARSDNAVVATLEAIDGGASLGSDPGIEQLAAVADDLGILAAELFTDGDSYQRLRPALLPGEVRIPAGEAVLLGTAISSMGLVNVNAVLYASEADAMAAAAMWAEAVAADPDWATLIVVDVRGPVLVGVVPVGAGSPDSVPPTGYQPAFS